MTAEEMKLSMYRTYVQNKWFTYIPTHYIVGCNGDFVKVNDMETVVGATLNEEANVNWIHIEIVWDFNQGQPNQSQYDMVNQLIEWILEKHPDMEVKGHWDFQAKNCPWANFDWTKIKGAVTSKYYTAPETIEFSLSRYYSVQPNQKRYYLNRSYEEDFKINCQWDCLYTANGHKLTDNDMYKSVACPKEYELWTKIYLEWIWVVTCNDRWGAINGNRLDMRCGIADKALDNRSKCPTGTRQWYVLDN